MYYLKSSGYLLKFRCGDINFNFKNHRNTLSIVTIKLQPKKVRSIKKNPPRID